MFSLRIISPAQCSQSYNNLAIGYYLEAFSYQVLRLHMAIILIIIISLTLSLALFSSILTLQSITAQEEIRLEAVTDQATFKVEILWMPSDIGNVNNFEIHFIDPDTGSEIEDVKYDFSIYKDGRPEIQRLDQVSISQEFFFEETGSYEISIDDIEDLGERVTIPIQVTPEFQSKIFVLSAAALGLAVLAIAAAAQVQRQQFI
jgi:hypothetical protein